MKPPSNFALRIIVEEDQKSVRILSTRYADAAADGGLEVVEKNALLDVLARHFVGRPLPRTGDIPSTRRLMADLRNAMIAARWSALRWQRYDA